MSTIRTTLTATVAVALAALAAGCSSAAATPTTESISAAAAPAATHCDLAFRYGIGVGPDTGKQASGVLAFDMAADGTLTGTFTPTGGKAATVLGQTSGLSVTLALPTPNNGFVFGSGQFTEPLSSGHCGISAGGTLTGPAEGDLGDWLAPSQARGIERVYVTECPPGASPSIAGAMPGQYAACIPDYYNTH